MKDKKKINERSSGLLWTVCMCILFILCFMPIKAQAAVVPTIPTGEGTSESPYIITSEAELFGFAEKVGESGDTPIYASLQSEITVSETVMFDNTSAKVTLNLNGYNISGADGIFSYDVAGVTPLESNVSELTIVGSGRIKGGDGDNSAGGESSKSGNGINLTMNTTLTLANNCVIMGGAATVEYSTATNGVGIYFTDSTLTVTGSGEIWGGKGNFVTGGIGIDGSSGSTVKTIFLECTSGSLKVFGGAGGDVFTDDGGDGGAGIVGGTVYIYGSGGPVIIGGGDAGEGSNIDYSGNPFGYDSGAGGNGIEAYTVNISGTAVIAGGNGTESYIDGEDAGGKGGNGIEGNVYFDGTGDVSITGGEVGANNCGIGETGKAVTGSITAPATLIDNGYRVFDRAGEYPTEAAVSGSDSGNNTYVNDSSREIFVTNSSPVVLLPENNDLFSITEEDRRGCYFYDGTCSFRIAKSGTDYSLTVWLQEGDKDPIVVTPDSNGLYKVDGISEDSKVEISVNFDKNTDGYYEVSSSEELARAITYANVYGTVKVKLTDDITIDYKMLTISDEAADITLDLNGHRLSGARGDFNVFKVNGGKLKILGRGILQGGVGQHGGVYPAISINGGTVTFDDALWVEDSEAGMIHPTSDVCWEHEIKLYTLDNGFYRCIDEDDVTYQPAVQVTADNAVDLGIALADKEKYIDYYAISNAGQLYWFAGLVNGTLDEGSADSDANAVLTADITVNTGVLTSVGELNGDGSGFRVWTPIGTGDAPYVGTFDGAGHTVGGLYLDAPSREGVGLIGCTTGMTMDVGIIDSYLNGYSSVGGVCGHSSGKIANCYNTGTINGYAMIGGVCGYAIGEITKCYNTGIVRGGSQVGGVCGYIEGDITNSYNTGAISGTSDFGGVCGIMNGTITNCYYQDGCVSGDNSYGTAKDEDAFSSGVVTLLQNTNGGLKFSSKAFEQENSDTINRILATASADTETFNFDNTDDYSYKTESAEIATTATIGGSEVPVHGSAVIYGASLLFGEKMDIKFYYTISGLTGITSENLRLSVKQGSDSPVYIQGKLEADGKLSFVVDTISAADMRVPIEVFITDSAEDGSHCFSKVTTYSIAAYAKRIYDNPSMDATYRALVYAMLKYGDGLVD